MEILQSNSVATVKGCFFFVQMFVILLLISLCIDKLTILKPNCEETSVWISMLSSLVGYILPNPRL